MCVLVRGARRSGKERWQGWSPEDESLLQDTYRGTDGESLFTFKTLQGVGGFVLLERGVLGGNYSKSPPR